MGASIPFDKPSPLPNVPRPRAPLPQPTCTSEPSNFRISSSSSHGHRLMAPPPVNRIRELAVNSQSGRSVSSNVGFTSSNDNPPPLPPSRSNSRPTPTPSPSSLFPHRPPKKPQLPPQPLSQKLKPTPSSPVPSLPSRSVSASTKTSPPFSNGSPPSSPIQDRPLPPRRPRPPIPRRPPTLSSSTSSPPPPPPNKPTFLRGGSRHELVPPPHFNFTPSGGIQDMTANLQQYGPHLIVAMQERRNYVPQVLEQLSDLTEAIISAALAAPVDKTTLFRRIVTVLRGEVSTLRDNKGPLWQRNEETVTGSVKNIIKQISQLSSHLE